MAEQVAEQEESQYRLPRSVVPDRYEVFIDVDVESSRFRGELVVDVRVGEPVAEVVLNAVELEVADARLANETVELTGEVTIDEATERATIVLDGEASPGDWRLHLRFAGALNEKLAGFYRSTFKDADGNERVIATTQFEATDARRAFPCWDEPDLKAVFSITLAVDDSLMAVSNGPVVEETQLEGGRRRVRFADTMRMSTYLVAFVVGPFEATEPVDVDGIPLRVLHVPGKADMAQYALDVGAHALRYFTDYFGIAYPAEKLDLIALPDFAFGAMENLGAVTFRETALLVDPETGSRLDRERVADVVCHEIAHMWFGDLVTMRWWNGIWLNEAFATFMELLAVDDYRPQWTRWVSFGTSRAAAMTTDGTSATRPIEFPVHAPEDAEGMFDVLTYQKGGSVVRMLEQFLGAERFRDGIRLYMRKHEYGNTETTDLWDAIEEASGEPVRSMMDSWIFQGGHPVISVETTGSGSGVRLAQKRFRYLPAADDDGPLWHVPVLLRASVDGAVEERRLILDGKEAEVELDGGKVDWIVVNSGGSGFYRTLYRPELLRALTGGGVDLDAIERFNLLSDTWASVLAGLADPSDFVELTSVFTDERDPNVWQIILAPFDLFDRVLGEDRKSGMQQFVQRLVGPVFEQVGWERADNEDEKMGTLRGVLVAALAGVGADEDVRARVLDLHSAYLEDRSSVDPDLVGALVSVTSKIGGEAEYQSFLDRFRSPATPQEEVRYLYGLAGFRPTGLIKRTLDMALSQDVRSQNAPFLVQALLANPKAGPITWEWIEEHWDEITSRYPDNSHARMLDSITTLFPHGDFVDRVRSFLEAHPVKAGHKTVQQALERLEVNRRFADRTRDTLADVF